MKFLTLVIFCLSSLPGASSASEDDGVPRPRTGRCRSCSTTLGSPHRMPRSNGSSRFLLELAVERVKSLRLVRNVVGKDLVCDFGMRLRGSRFQRHSSFLPFRLSLSVWRSPIQDTFVILEIHLRRANADRIPTSTTRFVLTLRSAHGASSFFHCTQRIPADDFCLLRIQVLFSC